jgi:hypothetical protein
MELDPGVKNFYIELLSYSLPTASYSSTGLPKRPGGLATRIIPQTRKLAQTTFNSRHFSRSMHTEKSITNTGEENRIAVESPIGKKIRLKIRSHSVAFGEMWVKCV